MKKLLTVMIVGLLITSSIAYAEEPVTNGSFKLEKGTMSETIDLVVFDQANVKITIDSWELDLETSSKGIIQFSKDPQLIFNVVIENGSDASIIAWYTKGVYLNSWDVSGGIFEEVDAGKKKRSTITAIITPDVGITSIDDLEVFEIYLSVVDSESYEDVVSMDKLVIEFI